MKRILSAVIFILSVAAAHAQVLVPEVSLKPIGLVGPDSTKNYVVILVPKATKADLYKKTLTYLNSIYKNPAKVISSVDGESITVNGYTDEIKGSFHLYTYSMHYNINLQFKDGKIKLQPNITDLIEDKHDSKPDLKYYINSYDSPDRAEVNCIYLKQVGSGKVVLFNQALKSSIDIWANNYVAGIVKSFNDNW